MKTAINAKRRTDAIISIRQDNVARNITIQHMNGAAERLTGYTITDILNQNFSTILSPRVNQLISEDLEFSSENVIAMNDFASVARKIPNFQILSKNGEVIPVSIKVFNLVGNNRNIQEYELLIRDITLISKIEELKDIMRRSEGTIQEKDPDTGLMSINSIVFALDTSYAFLKQYHAIDVCFALIEISNIRKIAEQHGEPIALKLIGALGNIVKKCCRKEDIVGYMGDGIVGMVLIDCNSQGMEIVLKRIRATVSSAKITLQGNQSIILPLSISYSQLRTDKQLPEMIDACENGLERIADKGGDGVVQV